MHARRIKPLSWQLAALAALFAAMLMALPRPARAEGLFDFLFGGFHRQSPPGNVNSYAEPPARIGRVAPASPNGTEDVRQGNGNIGRTVAFCVRLCDGEHFPLEHMTNATPIETCRAMCPASKTKVFSAVRSAAPWPRTASVTPTSTTHSSIASNWWRTAPAMARMRSA